MSVEEKLKRLQELNDKISLLGQLSVDLRDEDHFDEADKIDEQIDQLALAAGMLEHETLEEWSGKAQSVTESFNQNLKEVDESIKSIKKNIKTADSVIKGISSVEKALGKIMKSLVLITLFILTSCATVQKNVPAPETTMESNGFISSTEEEIVLDHKYFKVYYSPVKRSAKYVVYELKAENLKVKGAERANKFNADPLLVKMNKAYVKPTEYARTGYDKGHLAPSADFGWDQKANDLTFVMSNMSPQTPGLNRDAWRRLEDQVRKWACGEGRVTVITGPIYGTSPKKLKSGLEIPEKFFKIIIDETEPKKVISFVMEQTDKGEVFMDRISDTYKLAREYSLTTYIPKAVVKDRLPANVKTWKAKDCK